MTIALTVYLANAASVTVSTADQLYIISGSPANTQSYSKIGNNVTGYGELEAQANNGNTWAAGGSIGSPTGKGFFYDSTSLEGQQFVSGNWTPSVRLNASQSSGTPQAGTLTGDIIVRAYKYNSGTYTLIVSSTLTAQTVNSTFTTYALPATSASATSFSSTGDKLYIDIWFNCTANANANANQGIRLNRLSTDTGGKTGDANAQLVTPGYQSLIASSTMSSTDALTVSDSYLVLRGYSPSDGLSASDTVIASGGTALLLDALIASSVLAGNDIASFLDVLAANDATLSTQGIAVTESLIISETAIYTRIPLFVDLTVIADTWSASSVYAAIESLIATEALSQSGAWNPSPTMLILSDSFQSPGGSQFIDAVVGSSQIKATGGYGSSDAMSILDSFLNNQAVAWLESNAASDSNTVTGIYGALDPLAISDFFKSNATIIWLDPLAVSDAFSSAGLASSPQIPVIVVAKGRDGSIVARGRDGRIIVVGRDGSVTARGY